MTELSPEDKMIKARVQLLLNHPFFGYFLTHLRFKSTDSLTETAAVEYNRKRNEYKDHLYYNPDFVSRLDTNEVMGLEVHEMLHILLQQEQRRGDREENKFYLASEISVNDTALKAGFTLPGETDEKLRGVLPDKKTEGKSVEEIYDLLPPTLKIEVPIHVIFTEEGDEDSRSTGPPNQTKGTPKGLPHFIDAKQLKSIISEAAAFARMYGTMPAGLELFVDDLLTPKMNWREMLWRYVTREFVTDYSWASPNRRYVQHGIYLPGVIREALELVVCIDTSGSIDKDTLSEFFAEIRGIVASYENTRAHVIVCDSEVTDVQDIDEFNVEKIEFKGGGGTSFIPALERAQEFNPKVCVYLTDGAGEFPEEAPSFQVIWALTNPTEVPFGTFAVIE
ncbi:MAG: VWA-like domain-containing protein [Nitrososphaerales archaeon]|jgi:predicted metal-dependent peptidase